MSVNSSWFVICDYKTLARDDSLAYFGASTRCAITSAGRCSYFSLQFKSHILKSRRRNVKSTSGSVDSAIGLLLF